MHSEPRPEGRGMIWKGLRTPPKCSSELPGPKGPGFPFLDQIQKELQIEAEQILHDASLWQPFIDHGKIHPVGSFALGLLGTMKK